MKPTQLPLALSFRPALNAEDFLVADCNETAVAWVDRWPDWPGPGLIVHGAQGSGKTHLIQVWAARSNATVIPAAELGGIGDGNRHGSDVAVDGIDAVAGHAEREQALLHLYNETAAHGGKVLMTTPLPASRLDVRLPDLASRLRSAASAEILAPDDAVLAAVLVKQFADRQLVPPAAVIAYLIARMERSFEAARNLVDRLDRASLGAGRPISLALVRRTLAGTPGW